VEAGTLEGQHVELIEGMLVRVPPQGPMHGEVVEALGNEAVGRLREAFGRRYRGRVQLPIIAPDESEPEPDFAVVDGDLDRSSHPSSAHLVVEVTDTFVFPKPRGGGIVQVKYPYVFSNPRKSETKETP